ncbi:hypothetical protein J7E81_15560 [Bacillus sp. ISL-18]|uniref:hypothetical protein n=1 Tax=Bacillus sp. ISL-18 TaxID=2819118 RepID=UPI001BE74509|nr:hypothetical protein [Bacillus sp. ISL-18]MBT2656636.1 hypothetical protein [Bacillus sp. ISL-18]
MNYSIQSIRIPSRWFDQPERKMNTFQKMGGYKGFYLYLQLYKFRLHNQENEHTFLTSISLLRKETGYTTEDVFGLLKKLKAAKVISIAGASRSEYLLDGKGEIKEDKILSITVCPGESFPIFNEFDKAEDFYIYISFRLLKGYEDKKLDEKHFALHCLVQRLQHNKNNVCYMAIETMSEILGIDKDTINRMIINLNRHQLMVSWRKKNEHRRGEGSYRYEHITFEDNGKYANKDKGLSQWNGWLFHYKDDMQIITNRANRKAERKSKQRNKNSPEKFNDDLSNLPDIC